MEWNRIESNHPPASLPPIARRSTTRVPHLARPPPPPQGTPLAMLTMLAKYREHLNPVGVQESVVVQRRKDDPVLVEAPIVSFAIIFRPKWW